MCEFELLGLAYLIVVKIEFDRVGVVVEGVERSIGRDCHCWLLATTQLILTFVLTDQWEQVRRREFS